MHGKGRGEMHGFFTCQYAVLRGENQERKGNVIICFTWRATKTSCNTFFFVIHSSFFCSLLLLQLLSHFFMSTATERIATTTSYDEVVCFRPPPPPYEKVANNSSSSSSGMLSKVMSVWRRQAMAERQGKLNNQGMMVDKKQVEQAVTMINIATEMDHSGNHQMAVDLYMMGLDRMLSAFPCKL